jgi:heptosyltransferase-1
MQDVLFIKTSSLGDVIHNFPAVTEAHARCPDARFAWVVEEAFAPLVRLHPAVDLTIPVAGRKWRGAIFKGSTWHSMRAFMQALRARHYDEVIDTQGLFFKSALIARSARGRRHGYDSKSIKEPAAAWFYDVRHHVPWDQHAILRNRALTAQALGYATSGPSDFGLIRSQFQSPGQTPYAVLLHATARGEKRWPEENWRTLTATLGSNIDLLVPYGTADERQRADRIASASARAQVPDRVLLDRMAWMIAGASFVIGVDTGLVHLAAALGVPLVAIFSATDPALTGPVGSGPIAVAGGRGASPSADDVLTALELVLSQRS